MAHRDPKACHELWNSKWLREIIIRPGVQSADLIEFLPTGRDNNDRHRGPLPERLEYLEPILIRKTEIQKNQIRLSGNGHVETDPSCARFHHFPSVCFQRRSQKTQDGHFVFDDEQ